MQEINNLRQENEELKKRLDKLEWEFEIACRIIYKKK
jgi:ubiquinone biosynthesis protein UbiJ